jgi:hypothetical protein
MIQTVWFILAEGFDRVIVQTRPPTEEQRAGLGKHRVYRAHVHFPDCKLTSDGKLFLTAEPCD